VRDLALESWQIDLPPQQGTRQTQPINHPDVMAELVGARTAAEACAVLLKARGEKAEIERGRRTYAEAKSESDAAIATLLIALSTDRAPEVVSSAQSKWAAGVWDLGKFCSVSDKYRASFPIPQLAVGPSLKTLSEGISRLFADYRSNDIAFRKALEAQLEAAKWPDFDKIDVPR
jgi:hypothetical protein